MAVEMLDRPVLETTAPAPLTPPRRRPRAPRVLLPPLVLAAAVISGWTLLSDHLMQPSKRFLLPSPIAVVRAGILDGASRTEILQGLGTTAKVAFVGLAVSIMLGVGLAILMSQARWVERAVYPYAVVLQTIPILAVVPLIGYWAGFEFRSRVLVCVLISIFPIITNSLFGLKSVDPGLHDLFTLHHVNRVTRLRKLQLPAALPAMVEGFRISAGLSVIGAIVADFFFRQGDPGIGRLIDVYRQRLATEQLITAVLLSSLLGVAAFGVFSLLAARVNRRTTPRERNP